MSSADQKSLERRFIKRVRAAEEKRMTFEKENSNHMRERSPRFFEVRMMVVQTAAKDLPQVKEYAQRIAELAVCAVSDMTSCRLIEMCTPERFQPRPMYVETSYHVTMGWNNELPDAIDAFAVAIEEEGSSDRKGHVTAAVELRKDLVSTKRTKRKVDAVLARHAPSRSPSR